MTSSDQWSLDDPRFVTMCRITDLLTQVVELQTYFVTSGGVLSGIVLRDIEGKTARLLERVEES